jgi:hypothetical protein
MVVRRHSKALAAVEAAKHDDRDDVRGHGGRRGRGAGVLGERRQRRAPTPTRARRNE